MTDNTIQHINEPMNQTIPTIYLRLGNINRKVLFAWMLMCPVFSFIASCFSIAFDPFKSGFGTYFSYAILHGTIAGAVVIGVLWSLKTENLMTRIWTAILVWISISIILILMVTQFINLWPNVQNQPCGSIFFVSMFGSLIFGSIGYRERILQAKANIQEEKIRALMIEKALAETHLKVLQAQMEPHFLFNTLSNILSLIDTDINKAKAMQLALIQYLRSSLTQLRSKATTLGQEFAMIEAYLCIYQVRMSGRLKFTINLPQELKELPFAPMLIHPIIEKTIGSGIESRVKGGELIIQTNQMNDTLFLKVIDKETCFFGKITSEDSFVELKQRLNALYGPEANITVESTPQNGKTLNLMISVKALYTYQAAVK